jgi:hypothetical protein
MFEQTGCRGEKKLSAFSIREGEKMKDKKGWREWERRGEGGEKGMSKVEGSSTDMKI